MDKTYNIIKMLVFVLVVAGLIIGFQHAAQAGKSSGAPPVKAVAVLYPTTGNQAHGSVMFTKVGNGVKVVADVEGLSPGNHGFHIHEFGDCTALDGKSAGGHFNPDGTPHGAPTASAKNRHVGDLGNITAHTNGKAHLELVDSLLTFDGPHSVIGRGVIVHAGKDDLTSQPTGAAGSRMACGVIGIAKE
jgi:superoxide dismutase, Cu-Zn family